MNQRKMKMGITFANPWTSQKLPVLRQESKDRRIEWIVTSRQANKQTRNVPSSWCMSKFQSIRFLLVWFTMALDPRRHWAGTVGGSAPSSYTRGDAGAAERGRRFVGLPVCGLVVLFADMALGDAGFCRALCGMRQAVSVQYVGMVSW